MSEKLTNEEAIRRIKDFGLYHARLHHAIGDLPHSHSYKTVEAFEMAIEALSAADERKGHWVDVNGEVNDLISRRTAIEAIRNISIPLTAFGKTAKIYRNVKLDAVKQLEALPSIDILGLDRLSGKWIDVNGDGSVYRCNDNFCPNCGADMRGKQNG